MKNKEDSPIRKNKDKNTLTISPTRKKSNQYEIQPKKIEMIELNQSVSSDHS
jgi:hypothetical protein